MYRFLSYTCLPICHRLLNCRNPLSLNFCYYIDIDIDIDIDIIYNLLGIFLFFRKLHGLTQTQQKKKKKNQILLMWKSCSICVYLWVTLSASILLCCNLQKPLKNPTPQRPILSRITTSKSNGVVVLPTVLPNPKRSLHSPLLSLLYYFSSSHSIPAVYINYRSALLLISWDQSCRYYKLREEDKWIRYCFLFKVLRILLILQQKKQNMRSCSIHFWLSIW